MDRTLDGRTAFVTAGWQGVGAAITEELLALGARVGVGYRRKDAELDEFEADHADDPVSVHRGALSDPADCRRTVDEFVELRGRLDVLVALLNFRQEGLLSIRRTLPQLTDGEWDRALSAHLSSGFYIAQAALTHMLQAGAGRIVFVLGPSGLGDAQGHYGSIRAALRAFTRRLAVDVAGAGVTVNQVTTGLVNDELLAELPEDALQAAVRRIPVGRPAEAVEVARVVSFLASPDSGYLTGQVIEVDGGLASAMA